jgi:hypothetical protein
VAEDTNTRVGRTKVNSNGAHQENEMNRFFREKSLPLQSSVGSHLIQRHELADHIATFFLKVIDLKGIK